jgi:hypothetical protein
MTLKCDAFGFFAGTSALLPETTDTIFKVEVKGGRRR